MNTNQVRSHVGGVKSNVRGFTDSISDDLEMEIEVIKEAWIDTKEYAKEALDDAKEAWHDTKKNIKKAWLNARKYKDKAVH